MKPEIWTPHVTVAAIVERDGRFLVIEEHTSSGLRINQPAGHLEAGETLVDAVIRETLEETARPFEPDALVGIYLAHYERPARAGATYLRFAFCGRAGDVLAGRALDDGIVRTLWMTADELRACAQRHRSPTVMRSVDDYLAGRRVPLDFVHTHSVAPYRTGGTTGAADIRQAVGK
ncbi:NUDIX hydrolase [Burkholderia sp. TSV86]|uniref:NUDIX hydrolase n=1 Tax=Burkholderia sp. TSV86 TaxID=1385594 RepID=UPI00075A0A5A|nr:NUDIX hydrolase [Burkholderia sp. TSV86]KVE39818.1 NUDIX hydrolase [Burkholderia sp. TSV86]